jgi:hypothetical protein
MNTPIRKSIRVPLLIGGIAALLFSTVAITSVPVMGWFHNSLEGIDGASAQEQGSETLAPALPVARSDAAKARASCDECGVIASMRQVAALENAPEFYEMTVRFRDGSTRVFSDASPTNWRPGARIVLIDGGKQSSR